MTVLDPDCRDSKHATCVGGPCACLCHDDPPPAGEEWLGGILTRPALPTPGIEFHVHGRPAAQGSKRHVGDGRMVEMSKHLKPWREAVQAAAEEAIMRRTSFQDAFGMLAGPCAISITFYVPRPKYHYGSGKNSAALRPEFTNCTPFGTPDLDKLARAVFDSLTRAAVWKDDGQASRLTATKEWADRNPVGAFIAVSAL